MNRIEREYERAHERAHGRVCRVCGEVKPLSEYYVPKNQHIPRTCKACWYKPRPDEEITPVPDEEVRRLAIVARRKMNDYFMGIIMRQTVECFSSRRQK